jgi:transcriptional regulator with XRE-family HTH domain
MEGKLFMESALGSIRTPLLQEDEHGNLIIPLGRDGKPDYGLVMRHFRYLKGWSAQEVSELYSQALEDCGEKEETPVSARWILLMEQKNRVPVDEKRRWLLATLLTIPPVYFGLKAPETLREGIKLILPTIVEPVDVTEYRARLQRFWSSSSYRNHNEEAVASCIYNLQETLLYGDKGKRDQYSLLLCDYLILYANICRYQGYYVSAIQYLNKAAKLAKEQKNYNLLAKAFYLRGYAFFDKWDSQPEKEDRTDLLHTLNDFAAALRAVDLGRASGQYVSQPVLAATLSGHGLAQAYNAHDAQDRRNALTRMDSMVKVIQASDFQHDEYFFHVNDEWHHMDKAEAFLAVGWPRSTLEELADVRRGDPFRRSRYIYMSILEAEAYAASGQIEMSVAYAENALTFVEKKMINNHLARLTNMYEGLRENKKYASSPDVARLGAQLLGVQRPDLFR